MLVYIHFYSGEYVNLTDIATKSSRMRTAYTFVKITLPQTLLAGSNKSRQVVILKVCSHSHSHSHSPAADADTGVVRSQSPMSIRFSVLDI